MLPEHDVWIIHILLNGYFVLGALTLVGLVLFGIFMLFRYAVRQISQ